MGDIYFMNKELILTLLNIPKVSRKTINYILSEEYDLELNIEQIVNVFECCRNKNKRIPLIGRDDIRKANEIAKLMIQECDKLEIGILSILDDDFPTNLKVINDNPVILFYKGNKSCLYEEKSVAIIGTRKPSEHGLKIAHRLGYLFGSDDYVVVSGLAKGCDELGHLGCVEAKGKSVAVLPCGLDTVYPASNKKLAKDILDNGGCLVSEYKIGTKPYKNLFVDRDRLQSALSAGIVVVEASKSSGTMHTVEYAKAQNKVVGCYKHKDDFENKETISGNIEVLKNKDTFSIEGPESLAIFKEALLNNDIVEKKDKVSSNEEFKEQITFDFTGC